MNDRFDNNIFTLGYNYAIHKGNCEKEMTYGEYVSSFADETTSPIGVMSRIHIRVNDCVNFSESDITEDDVIELYTWGCTGNLPKRLDRFDSIEDAYYTLLETFEQDMFNSCEGYFYAESHEDFIEICKEDEKEFISIYEQIEEEKRIKQTREIYEKQKEEKIQLWLEKQEIRKEGTSFEIAKEFFEKNKKEIEDWIGKRDYKVGEMSSKTSKSVAYAICRKFNAIGVNECSLSHVIR